MPWLSALIATDCICISLCVHRLIDRSSRPGRTLMCRLKDWPIFDLGGTHVIVALQADSDSGDESGVQSLLSVSAECGGVC